MSNDYEQWLQNQIRSREMELNELHNANESNISSISERKRLFQDLINRNPQTPSTRTSTVVNESSEGQTNNDQIPVAQEDIGNVMDDRPAAIRIIDQELGDLIHSQRVSSLLNSEPFRRALEERLQNSLASIQPTVRTSTVTSNGTLSTNEANNDVNLERILDPNNDPELQALVNYQIVSNMLQSAFRTHLENTLWSRHIRRGNHAAVPDRGDTGLNSSPMSANQNNLLHTMRNELSEMKSMMRILLQSQIETHRSIRQEVTSVLRSTITATDHNPINDLNSSCVICLNSMADTVIYRCGHLCLCYACSIQLRLNVARGTMSCPVCRTPIDDIVRIYGSSHTLTD